MSAPGTTVVASWAGSPGSDPAPPSAPDVEAVTELLGRAPRTRWTVAARCPHGTPSVIENAPEDLDGRPFPTRYWLVCRHLSAAVARLEAAGGGKEMEGDPAGAAALAGAHARHRALTGRGVAGTADPGHAKCLHAHLAFAIAEGGGPVAEWIAARADLSVPAVCCRTDAGEER